MGSRRDRRAHAGFEQEIAKCRTVLQTVPSGGRFAKPSYEFHESAIHYPGVAGVTGTAAAVRTCRRHCRHEYHTGTPTTIITGSHGARAMPTSANLSPKLRNAPHESSKVLPARMPNVAASIVSGPLSGVNFCRSRSVRLIVVRSVRF